MGAAKGAQRRLLGELSDVVGRLAVRRDVQAFALFVFRYPQADEDIHDLVADESHGAGPEQGHTDCSGLDRDLAHDVVVVRTLAAVPSGESSST